MEIQLCFLRETLLERKHQQKVKHMCSRNLGNMHLLWWISGADLQEGNEGDTSTEHEQNMLPVLDLSEPPAATVAPISRGETGQPAEVTSLLPPAEESSSPAWNDSGAAARQTSARSRFGTHTCEGTSNGTNTQADAPAVLVENGSSTEALVQHVPTRPVTRLQKGIRKPRIRTDGTVRYGCFTSTGEPQSLEEALNHDKWKIAMDDEYEALMKNNTWHLVPPEKGRNLIDCK